MNRSDLVLFLARLFTFVREVGGQNQGVWVQMIQKLTGNAPPDSWCASFVSLILGMAYEGQSPMPRTASCDVMLEHAREKGWLTTEPSVGDIFLRLNTPTDAHHVGFVTDISRLPTIGSISGNTSADGTSSNGDRVAEHDITPKAGTIIYVAYLR